jgi:cytosine permease
METPNSMDVQKSTNMERKALSRIPEKERQRWTSIAFIWIGTMICIPMLMVGGLLSSAMPFWDVVWSAVIGFGICAAIMCLGGIQGMDLGLPSSMCATKAFGDKGSSFVTSLVVFVAQLGWFGVQTATCATAFNALMGYWGVAFPFWLSCAIWGAVMLFTAVYGFKFLKVLNYIAVPALLIMCGYGVINAIANTGWSAIMKNAPGQAAMPFSASVSLVIGLFAVGTVINSDYSRYAKSRSATILATVLGVLPAAVFMFMVGAVMSLSAGNYDITAVFASMGLPVVSMLVLILATWTTNTSNAYTAGLAAMKVFSLKDERRPLVTVICGAIGTVIAILGLATVLEGFISILASLVPPVAGVMIADYWIVCRARPENWHPVRGFNWCGVIAWVCGCVVSLFFSFFSPALDGILVCAVVYLILHYTSGKTALGGRGLLTIDEAEQSLK